MVDRRLLVHFDVLILLFMLAIVGVGSATVYSATFDPTHPEAHAYAWRQLMWGSAGVLAAVLTACFDYRKLERYAYLLYAAGLGLLIAVPLIGSVGNGSRRWIGVGAFSVQPSEMMKLALIVALARYFHSQTRPGGLKLRDLVIPLALTLPPVALILAQPDLGTAGVFVFVFASMVLLAGLSSRTIGLLVGTALATVPA